MQGSHLIPSYLQALMMMWRSASQSLFANFQKQPYLHDKIEFEIVFLLHF